MEQTIEITDGFTGISAGSDCIDSLVPQSSTHALGDGEARRPTGVRMTVEFERRTALAPGQRVCVRYDFAGDGDLREGVGIVKAIHTNVRWGHAVVYHYRMSHWIAPADLAPGANRNVRYRTEGRQLASQPVEQQTLSAG